MNITDRPMTAWLRAPRWIILRLVAVAIIGAALASFAQSYRGLYLWAIRHGLTGLWAAVWPLQVDTFIAVGELALFVALVDSWPRRYRLMAAAVTGAGLVISVAGNIGHAPTHDLGTRITFAVPPLAAAASLFVGLVILKCVVDQYRQPRETVASVTAREVATARSGERGYGAALAAIGRPKPPATPRPERPAKARRGRRPNARPQSSRTAAKQAAMAALVAEPDLTPADLVERFGVAERTARRYVATAAANGQEHTPATST